MLSSRRLALPLFLFAIISLTFLSGCGNNKYNDQQPLSSGSRNLVPTPNFKFGYQRWSRFVNSDGGGDFKDRLSVFQDQPVLDLSRSNYDSPLGENGQGFNQFFLDIRLHAQQNYQLSAEAAEAGVVGSEKARIAIAPAKQWYSHENQLDFSSADTLTEKVKNFTAPKDGLYRLSIFLERTSGHFYIDHLYLSTTSGPYFDGDSPGAYWQDGRGYSQSIVR